MMRTESRMANTQARRAHPTVAEFKELLLNQSLEETAKSQVFTGMPYAFLMQPAAMGVLRKHLAGQLGIAPDDIVIIGSAQIGFSLSPDNFPRAFTKDSDIDVLLVDAKMFDAIWNTLLAWHYPRRFWLDGADWEWAKRRKDEIYWGWLEPSEIHYRGLSFPDVLRPMRDLSANWFNAFKSLARYPEFMGRDVNGRLYRTWDHALAYQVASLKKIKALIQTEKVT